MFVDESKHLFIYFFFSKKRYRRQRRQEKGFFVVFRVLPFQKNIAAKRARVQNTNYDSEYRSTNGRMHKEFSIKILVYMYIYISKKKHFEMIPGDTTTIQAVIIQRVCTIYIYIYFLSLVGTRVTIR